MLSLIPVAILMMMVMMDLWRGPVIQLPRGMLHDDDDDVDDDDDDDADDDDYYDDDAVYAMLLLLLMLRLC